MNTVDILGVRLNAQGLKNTKKEIISLLSSSVGSYIFTPNAEILYRTYKDDRLKKMLNSANLLLADGVGVTYASTLLGHPIPERITGIDTGEWILKYASQKDLSVFFLGGGKRIPEAAAKNMQKRISGLKISGCCHGYFDKSQNSPENKYVIDQIKKARPDILFVCFGFPYQERWIYENISSLPSVKLALGLGGSFDVWAGKVERSPRLVRAVGFEWLYRMIREPKRIARFPYLILFAFAVLKENYILKKNTRLEKNRGHNA